MGNGRQTIGFRYYMGAEAGCCLGPVDEFVQLDIGNRIAWRGSITSSQDLDIDEPNLFGGDSSEGGVSGIIEVRMGEDTQASSQYMVDVVGVPLPADRGMVTLVFRGRGYTEIVAAGLNTNSGGVSGAGTSLGSGTGVSIFSSAPVSYVGRTGFYWAAMNPYIKPIAPTMRRILAGWRTPVWYPTTARITQTVTYSSPPISSQSFQTVVVVNYTAGGTQVHYDTSNTDLTPDFTGFALIGTEWFRITSVDDINHILNVVGAQFTTTAANHISGVEIFLYNVDLNPIIAMNPAHIIYQCLTDPRNGLGKQTALIDDTQWRGVADALLAENFGLCLQWNDQSTLEDFLTGILRTIDSVLDFNLSTGLYELRLIRNDYDPSTLPIFDDSNIISMDSFERSGWGETTNEVIVQFTDPVSGGSTSVGVQDLASIQIQGTVVSASQQYPGIQDVNLAARVAQRDLTALSTPLAALTVKLNRTGYNVKKGDPVKISRAALGIVELIVRVIDTDQGELEDGVVTLTCVEDVFALPTSSYVKQQQSIWQAPNAPPVSVSVVKVAEIPYFILQALLAAADLNALTGTESFPLILAQRPAPQNNSFAVYQSDVTAFTTSQSLGLTGYVATIALSANAAWNDTTLHYATPVGDSPDLYTGGLALLGDEWIGITSVDLTAHTMVVVRGVLDSIPVAHFTADLAFFLTAGTNFHGFFGEDNPIMAGITEYYRVTGRSITAETKLVSAASVAHLHAATWNNPYPPANVKFDGSYFPSSVLPGFTISWNGRSRLQQTVGLVGWTDAGIEPEAGVTYTLEVYDATTLTLIQSTTGLTTTAGAGTFTYSGGLGAGPATSFKIVFYAVRGSLTSQKLTVIATV